MTAGIANATLDLAGFAAKDEFGYYDIDQILMTIYRFLNNVEKPRIVIPHAYADITYYSGVKAQEWTDYTERLMTGQWTDEGAADEYLFLSDQMHLELFFARRTTGRKSKAMFEKKFGRKAILDFDVFRDFQREWPCMEALDDWERPRCRVACYGDYCFCSCTYSSVEVSMPDPVWCSAANARWGFERARLWQLESSRRYY